MPDKAFYVTTPIYYVNDKPHLGHAYTTIMCDIVRRYYDLLNYETYMLTGTDEHGENIVRVARKSGRDIIEMVDDNSQRFRSLWPRLNIANDDFIRTTEPRHKRVVQMILQKTFDSGDIYQAEYGGNYCVKCERFYTDTETEARPGFCPIHESELEFIKETNYFFRLGKYREWLREKVETDPEFLRPAQFGSEVLALLREPLDDLCISRPVERLSWGIPLPFDEKYVTYVWYDALVNYVSGLDYPDGAKFARFWPNTMHMIAKDILRQHAVYWPCMLKAAGIPEFRRLRVHGWWTVEGKKMSKSLGNVVDPAETAAKYGLDVFRYFVARDMTFGADGDFSVKGLVTRNNSELGNDLGNLLSRVTAMIQKYCGGKMPPVLNPTGADKGLLSEIGRLTDELEQHVERCAIHALLDKAMAVVNSANRYVTAQEPWALAKARNSERVGTVLAVASQTLVSMAQLLYPVMPEKMTQLLSCYGLGRPASLRNEAVPAGTPVSAAQSLFPRFELEKTGAAEAESVKSAELKEAPASAVTEPAPPLKPEITFDDFSKIDLRIATILEAERVPKTDKLMRLTIDIGVEKRQIVGGVAQYYTPEQLIGRQIAVVANLAPRELKGFTSQGMLLAAKSGSALFLLRPDETLPPGSDIS